MGENFKFKLQQYVKITDEILKCNGGLPKYPCKVDYRFFDGKQNVYIIDIEKGEKRLVLENDLQPYVEQDTGGVIHEMQKTIYELQDRIVNLEFKIDSK